MSAYYNEIDPYAAQWLRNLIAAGHIAPGDVDERSINDVRADDLKGYTQCHFFAGIGVWSYALRLAGWPDDRPVWTGSCPCQPFSAAGKQQGTADERHLWPVWFQLIQERKPEAVFGEQVEAAIRHGWLDLVQSDMEGIGYAFAAAGIPAAGFGAPHIRQRLWFVAEGMDDTASARYAWAQRDTEGDPRGETRLRLPGAGIEAGIVAESDQLQSEQLARPGARPGDKESARACGELAGSGSLGRMGDNNNKGLEGHGRGHQAEGGREGAVRPVATAGESGGVADTTTGGQREHGSASRQTGHAALSGAISGVAYNQHTGPSRAGVEPQPQGAQQQSCHLDREESATRPGPTNGHWRDADWLHCRDGKWRPVEPGTFPLAHGAAARVGRLRAYGNAIVPQVAAEFIQAYLGR